LPAVQEAVATGETPAPVGARKLIHAFLKD